MSQWTASKLLSSRHNARRSKDARTGHGTRRWLRLEALEERQLLAILPHLVTDLNRTAGSSAPWEMTEVGGTVFFTPDTPTTGDELWKSDGTEAGTVRVKDIRPGSAGSSPQSLTDLNGTLYFFAYDGTSGGLWKSDGTEVGTVRVKDIWEEGRLSDLRHLTNVNGTLYFSAYDGIHGDELWTSDGTEAGTVMVAELAEGSGGSGPGLFTEVAGKLFFVASDDLHGGELWVADLGVSNDDRNRDGLIDVRDLDALCTALGDGTTTRETIEDFWARQNTGPGDANFDHVFDRFDLVAVLQRGKYETNSAASWNDGDFNCDGLFSRLDLVAALQRGWYQSL